MDATLVLCDYAEAVNGKLYMAGAGWTDMSSDGPVPVALGILIGVPWDRTNIRHSLLVTLETQDGVIVALGEPAEPVMQGADFEVGRPPGSALGAAIPLVLAMRWPVLPLAPASYAFVLQVDGTELARVSFRARPMP